MELEVSGLSCGYGKKALVRDISFCAHEKDIICILGPNGAGKTTFFRTVLGFLPKIEGSILLDGQDISKMKKRQLAKIIAYVPQTQSPAFSFRVREVVAMGCTASMNLFSSPSAADYRFCYDLLRKLGAEHLYDCVFNQISGGERQMVLIARALAQRPKLLMMDEPTSNLDFGNQVRVLKCIKRLADEGLGILMTTHFPDHAFLCATKVALFGKKEGFLYGTPEDIITGKNMEEIYRIQVSMTETENADGKKIRSCTPVIGM